MKLSKRVKPISYLKANAADLIRGLGEEVEPLIITRNGEAKAVLQSIEDYEKSQETIAMLKIMAMGEKEIEECLYSPAGEALERVRQRRSDSK